MPPGKRSPAVGAAGAPEIVHAGELNFSEDKPASSNFQPRRFVAVSPNWVVLGTFASEIAARQAVREHGRAAA